MAETSLAIRNCGRFVEFACYAIGDQEEPLRRVAKVWYCRKRLCALCQWRNARWQQRQLSELVQNYQVAHPEEGAAMLSLTVPHPEDIDLADTVGHMLNAFRKLFRYKKVMLAVNAW